MEFKTVFNVKDTAWYMKNNKPTEVIISAIEIFYVNTNQDRIKYSAKDVTGSVSWLDHTNLLESMLFRTKADLLSSLFGDNSTKCKGTNCSAVNGINHSAECIEEHNAA